MKKENNIFIEKNFGFDKGSILIELLLSVALVAVMMPFVFRYQQNSVRRVENIAVMRHMEDTQSALERYILENRDNLLNTVGKNIIRINPSDLADYGVAADVIENKDDKYQLRILKSNDINGKATLQGVILYNDPDISPLRTREIVSMAGGDLGFVDGVKAFGSFGAWRANTVDLGLGSSDGIIGITPVTRDIDLYLWRVPSDNEDDATMMSALNLGGHDIKNATFIDSEFLQLEETLLSPVIATKDTIFQNRITIDGVFESKNATVSGILSSDSRNLEVNNMFSLEDTGKFSSFTTNDLWVYDLSLSGLSIYTEDDSDAAILKINKMIDMTNGRIDALQVSVGFTGSITPKLVVRNRIEDSINNRYFWDLYTNTAYFNDLILAELTRMAPLAVYMENDKTSVSSQVFGAVSANKNATVSDYLNAITEIQRKVTEKYRQLNLE